MSDVNEINAFSGKINLTLLNAIVKSFRVNAPATNIMQKKMSGQCVFLMTEKKNVSL